ncbi:GH1 family beta-glucosidase [Oceanotoga sp. DSM 15011]|jgi:beta-glucosidase|uniref:GH1 family beta-glucosidase n=1 Tax=Oceanotoga sp. DSM 15011 TaxID=2984951 RepID=UPI0021F4A599|nr:GH1 family beta-glucosidase [Oceanotoga sp. DSM 15011]UYO98931.1 GH1 family beta-glucosidase [Oceanotoga sp. DSM 15011]
MKYQFDKDFLWGVATASYQIEGAYDQDGRIPSIWDTFSKTPGNTYMGHNGDEACDHYNKFKEDIALLKKLGIKAYRFSISWPRIFKDGKYKLNEKGLKFYKDLVEELKKNDIKPIATLYHWDLPQILQDEGGWSNPEIIKYFVHYASVMFNALGDDVEQWITFNETSVFLYLGYLYGIHAPGIKNLDLTLKAIHNVHLAHGETVKLFKNSNYKNQIGITLNLSPNYPYSVEEKDIIAAKTNDAFWNRMFLDPILKGSYPEEILNNPFGNTLKKIIKDDDMEIISHPIDFLGINYYSRSVIKHDENETFKYKSIPQDGEKTSMGWEVYPDGLRVLLNYIKENYGNIPLYITENGAAYEDKLENGKIHDIDRINYLKRHFISAKKAIDEGVNLKGYYVWSFMDNYEWAEGYVKRFGLTYIDYETKERILKDSAKWYSQVIKNNFIEE